VIPAPDDPHDTPPPDRTYVVALGANLGPCVNTLRSATRALDLLGTVDAISRLYLTEPMYVTDQPTFYNAAVRLRTALSPHGLLHEVRRIESEHGRVRDLRFGPRTLDLDILSEEDTIIDDPDLQLPHPRLQERPFALFPLHDVHPTWVDPRSGRHITELLRPFTSPVAVDLFDDDHVDDGRFNKVAAPVARSGALA